MSNKKSEYHVGELANFFGISKDTIRLYDNMGILSAAKDNLNNYRVYNREDFLCLDYIMRLREMQFSLEDIRVLINESGIEKAEAMMQLQEKIISDKIEELKYIKEMVSDYKKNFAQVIRNVGKINIKISPPMILKEIESSMLDVMSLFLELSKSQTSRFTFVCQKKAFLSEEFYNNLNDSKKRQELFRYAITLVDEEYISSKEGFPKDKLEVIEPRRCVYGIAKNYTNMDYSGFEEIRKYVLDNNLTVKADPLFRVVSFRNNKMASVDYYEAWVPIE